MGCGSPTDGPNILSEGEKNGGRPACREETQLFSMQTLCNPPFLTVIKANSIPGSAVLGSNMLGPQQQSLLIQPRTARCMAGWLPWWEGSGQMSRCSSSLFCSHSLKQAWDYVVWLDVLPEIFSLICHVTGGLYRTWRLWQMALLQAVVGLCSGKTLCSMIHFMELLLQFPFI